LVGTLAGGDALIGLRARGDTNRPFTLVNAMQAEAEARFRQTEQALQAHLDDVEKQLRSLRAGDDKKTDAVITPEQRAAIDAARKDIVDTRQKLRAVQLELNRDISRPRTELQVFDIVLVPAVLAVVAIGLGVVRRRRRARARA
ncbi:MAG: ABC transporter, partial [Rhodospirillales bacterium]|nr:ABC transporter [Rhodospirillales bacterium]